jgi:protocatechuate 3,4-dioxygenase beta subunit
MAGAAVYIWHCDRDGNYSLYSQAVTTENYLRGVQAADSNGVVAGRTGSRASRGPPRLKVLE